MRIDHTRLRVALAMLLAAALALGVAACGGSDDNSTSSSSSSSTSEGGDDEGGTIFFRPQNRDITLTVGSKNFTEQIILGEIYAQGLEAAGFTVKRDLNLGSETVAHQAVKSGAISGYPEYASTALTSFFGVEPEDVPANAEKASIEAAKKFAKEGLTSFEPTPFASANAVGTLKKTAEENELETVSDLEGKSEELTLYGSPECRQRIDCLAGLEKYYGLKFKSFHPVDIGLRYTVLDKGQADLSILFTTDAQLAAEKDKYVILRDDKHVFPAGNVIWVSGDELVTEAGPDYKKTIDEVQEGLTLPVMQELDARVELEKQSPKAVATAYLKSAGYID